MKRLSIFETSIIGFFVGVIVAAYLTYLESVGGFIGHALNWISLRALIPLFHIPEDMLLVASFVLCVLAYTIYGLIIGIILRNPTPMRRAICALAIIGSISGIIYEQGSGTATWHGSMAAIGEVIVTPINPTPKVAKQYFGTEAIGDLDNDGRDDVAFLIRRNDADTKGTVYYLSAALAAANGHIGTSLIFLGDKAAPESIKIDKGTITVEYTIGSSAVTKRLRAHVVEGNLEKVI
jgi:hypothetical protein